MSTEIGNVYLTDTIYTNGKAYNAENLEPMTIFNVKKCQSAMQCCIRSVVTDNTANVNKM